MSKITVDGRQGKKRPSRLCRKGKGVVDDHEAGPPAKSEQSDEVMKALENGEGTTGDAQEGQQGRAVPGLAIEDEAKNRAV